MGLPERIGAFTHSFILYDKNGTFSHKEKRNSTACTVSSSLFQYAFPAANSIPYDVCCSLFHHSNGTWSVLRIHDAA